MRIWAQAGLVAASSQLAGVVQYIYYVWATRSLTSENLYTLNTDIAYISLAMTLGGVFQYLALFSGVVTKHIKLIRKIEYAVMFLFFAYFIVSGGHIRHISWSVPFFWLVSIELGVLQKNQKFGLFSGVFLVLAVARLLPSLFDPSLMGFSAGFFLSPIVALPLIWILYPTSEHVNHVEEKSSVWSDLFAVSLVSLSQTLYPVLDFILISKSSSDLGTQYSEMMVFTKALFFLPASLLQVTLPRYLSAAQGNLSAWENEKKSVKRLENLGLGLSLFGAFALAFVGPFAAEKIFMKPALQFHEYLLAGLNMVPFYFYLVVLQISSARKQWVPLVSIFVLSLLPGLLGFVLGSSTWNGYFALALPLNIVLALVFLFKLRRSLLSGF